MRAKACKEPGVARFDVVQQQDDPTRFVLVEVYRDAAAAAAHKETKHYPVWRDAVAPMMAEPRSSVKFANLFPGRRRIGEMAGRAPLHMHLNLPPPRASFSARVRSNNAGAIAREFGRRALVVTGRDVAARGTIAGQSAIRRRERGNLSGHRRTGTGDRGTGDESWRRRRSANW